MKRETYNTLSRPSTYSIATSRWRFSLILFTRSSQNGGAPSLRSRQLARYLSRSLTFSHSLHMRGASHGALHQNVRSAVICEREFSRCYLLQLHLERASPSTSSVCVSVVGDVSVLREFRKMLVSGVRYGEHGRAVK